MESTKEARHERSRNLHFMSRPDLWPTWPYLAVVRRLSGEEEYGVLCDLFRATGKTGYRATVFESNLFLLPPSEVVLLNLPKHVYDTLDEVFEAGWRVD